MIAVEHAALLTIIMYHYVRDLPRTPYPKIKGLLTSKFEKQLEYIRQHYTVCSTRQVIAAVHGQEHLPENACMLTFDDGFSDHYVTVLPKLTERGMVASFYPPAEAIEARRVLDVHKVHFVLACADDVAGLTRKILELLVPHREHHELPDDKVLYETYAQASRFDPAEVVFVKQMLQHALPYDVRRNIVEKLFGDYVTEDEQTFASELYMDISQLREMIEQGMEIGGHGYRHVWLEHLSAVEQREELSQTTDFLEGIYGRRPKDWVMCYPFGSYNPTTLELLAELNCSLGLTTEVGIVTDLSRALELPRLDTHDLPC